MSMYHYTESGLRNVWLVNGFKRHTTPFGEGVSIADVQGLHQVLTQALVMKPGRLAGSEIRFLRKEMELSQRSLSTCLGVSIQTLAAWEKGKARIPGPADRMLRILVKGHFDNNVHVKQLIDTLNDLELAQHEHRILFQESGNQWRKVA